MTGSSSIPLPLERAFADAFPELGVPWESIRPANPQLTVLNEPLARELGLDPEALRTEAGVRALLGNDLASGAKPVAQVYAGHQFGSYSARLGDGRALLLGELRTSRGTLLDVHLKGSGPTPFSRGGDGFAALGPMLREYLVSEAMHVLGIPTTRALAVISTGRRIERDGDLVPGAVLVRVAASHLRVGTFQYARATSDTDLLARLVSFALERHAPDRVASVTPALELLDHVVAGQAALIARWTLAGFVHGVMNTDNMTISGETIDYGPCAFLDRYDPAAVFSSIDRQGRYAYGAQPSVALWNLTRFAEALLPLIAGEVSGRKAAVGQAAGGQYTEAGADADGASEAAIEAARDVLACFGPAYDSAWTDGMRDRLGLGAGVVSDAEVVQRATETLTRIEYEHGDYTLSMRAENEANPLYVARNALLDEALAAATAGDLGPFEQMLAAVTDPAHERAGFERLAEPPAAGARRFISYCGT
ncbi:protein adenylyltransferase SelO [Leucobacter salsicius]|uniref:protein adenylyltransferase SelO n=1 Tax=Leucobacter salsicius TaxID=664638 RepID=UPI0003482025|nr:protein adenylyltransferase SelO family protein [Leucobacter salsicius]